MLQSDEAPGKTQETLIRLFFLAGLGTSWCPMEEGSIWVVRPGYQTAALQNWIWLIYSFYKTRHFCINKKGID